MFSGFFIRFIRTGSLFFFFFPIRNMSGDFTILPKFLPLFLFFLLAEHWEVMSDRKLLRSLMQLLLFCALNQRFLVTKHTALLGVQRARGDLVWDVSRLWLFLPHSGQWLSQPNPAQHHLPEGSILFYYIVTRFASRKFE